MEVQLNSNINLFLSFKSDTEVQELDDHILENLVSIFGSIDKNKKNKKSVKKSNINILKNQKIQNKKDSIVNRVNLILNKLSETNIDVLTNEFLENINQVDEDNFEEIQRTFYLKIISEINFIKIYLQFLKVLGFIYWKVQSYDLSYFISIVESKFKLDYTDFDIGPDSKFEFVRELDGETKRINNLILIKNLMEQKFINETLNDNLDHLIINQNVFLPDIYYWFNSRNKELSNEEKNRINELLRTPNLNSREIVLLESLINKTNKIKQISITTTTIKQPIKANETSEIKTDTLKLELDNIIEEYILIRSIDDIKYFIENRCSDAISKNKFCESILERYFKSNKETSNELVELLKQLIKSQILFKSNLSRGLLLINNNWKDRSVDFNKPIEKMKGILNILKSIGITKNIEFLFDQYKISLLNEKNHN
jgi:hypothetical protein